MDGMQTKEGLNKSLKVVGIWKSFFFFLREREREHEKGTVFWNW